MDIFHRRKFKKGYATLILLAFKKLDWSRTTVSAECLAGVAPQLSDTRAVKPRKPL